MQVIIYRFSECAYYFISIVLFYIENIFIRFIPTTAKELDL